jgi:hypothetical protein
MWCEDTYGGHQRVKSTNVALRLPPLSGEHIIFHFALRTNQRRIHAQKAPQDAFESMLSTRIAYIVYRSHLTAMQNSRIPTVAPRGQRPTPRAPSHHRCNSISAKELLCPSHRPLFPARIVAGASKPPHMITRGAIESV